MKYLKIAGLALASMLMMSMALAGNAAAAPLWLLCLEGKNANNTKFENNQCTKVNNSTGKFESVSAPTKDAARITAFTLVLRDKKTPAGESEVKCNSGGVSEGTVGPGGEAEVTSAEVKEPKTHCTGEKVCEKTGVEEVKGANLPWKTKLVEGPEEMARTTIEGTGGGAGWKVKCKVAGLATTDTCTSETGKPESVVFLNVESGGVLLVLGRFLTERKAKCSLGGAESGEVIGLFALLLANGHGLSINLR